MILFKSVVAVIFFFWFVNALSATFEAISEEEEKLDGKM